jgi:transcriptional regulator of acetoin/glycerol metabolism
VLSRRSFEAMERAELARLLECHRWNVSAVARALGISRGGLRGRMTRLGLESTTR